MTYLTTYQGLDSPMYPDPTEEDLEILEDRVSDIIDLRRESNVLLNPDHIQVVIEHEALVSRGKKILRAFFELIMSDGKRYYISIKSAEPILKVLASKVSN